MNEDRSSGGRRVAAGNFVTVSTNAGRSTAAERTGERGALECTTGDPVLHPCSRPCYPVLLLLPFLYLFLLDRAAAPRLRPLQLLLADCIDLLRLLLPVYVRFSCCSPASAATPRLCPFQLLHDCVCFGCCSSMVSASTAAPASPAAPRLRPL